MASLSRSMLFERFAEINVRAVEIGEVEEADATVVGMPHQVDKLVETHPSLVGLPLAAVHAGSLA